MEFGPGLHVIYGESGVGKSILIHALVVNSETESTNFDLTVQNFPGKVQVVFQNPEEQIISDTVNGELSFGFECQSTNSDWISERLDKLKSDLPFFADGSRHPVTLSGGEKEMMNVLTALSAEPQLLLVDDALSFLNTASKKKMVSLFNQAARNKGTTIIWFTSDWRDIEFGQTQLELTLSSFAAIEIKKQPSYPVLTSPAGEMEIIIEDLDYSYQSDTAVFDALFAHHRDIRCLGIVGGNGCGKTTLAHILADGFTPESGRAEILIKSESPEIGFLDQFPERILGVSSLISFMEELIEAGKLDRYHVTQCVNTLKTQQIPWDKLKYSTAIDVSWTTLRVALIIILAHCRYDLLILDEPTFGLGWKQTEAVLHYLKEILTGKHLILISHDREFIETICDGILDLDSVPIPKQNMVNA